MAMQGIAGLNMHTPTTLDSTRGTVLKTSLPPVRPALRTATSTTKSRFRLRWDELAEWHSFEDDAVAYFNNVVPPTDLAALIANYNGVKGLWEAVFGERVRTEADIKRCVLTYVRQIHNIAARGASSAPLPSDDHSTLVPIEPGAGSYNLLGVSDFALFNELEQRVTAVAEVKNPWIVTPQMIDAVIDGSLVVHIFVNIF
jgi:hypothetical protein